MSALAHWPDVQVLRLPGNRATLTGPADHIGQILDELNQRGTLVDTSDPQPDGRPGYVVVTLHLRLPQATTPQTAVTTRLANIAPAGTLRTSSAFRVGRAVAIAAVVAAVLTVLGMVVWAVIALTAWVVAHLALILGALVLLAILAGTAGPRACRTIVDITHWH